jgi:hypothetical protein
MSAEEAAAEALDAAAQEAEQRGNPLHGRSLRLTRVVRGDNDGKDAWVIVLEVGKRGRACVWIWADQEVMRTTYNYFVDTCTQKVLRAKPDIVTR